MNGQNELLSQLERIWKQKMVRVIPFKVRLGFIWIFGLFFRSVNVNEVTRDDFGHFRFGKFPP